MELVTVVQRRLCHNFHLGMNASTDVIVLRMWNE